MVSEAGSTVWSNTHCLSAVNHTAEFPRVKCKQLSLQKNQQETRELCLERISDHNLSFLPFPA
jgi:hypothetical protein